MPSTLIKDVTGYVTSRDYELLVQLAMKQSVVCIVDYCGCRDVARTFYEPGHNKPPDRLEVSARGISYLGDYEITIPEFMAQCRKVNLEFLVPTL